MFLYANLLRICGGSTENMMPFAYVPIIGEFTLFNIFIFVVGLIILWIIVSVPVYMAGKIVTRGESTIGDAMIATFFGPLAYAVTLVIADFFLGAIIGSEAYVLALVIAFVAWIGVFKASFKAGWLGAFAIAVLAILIFAAISIFFGTLLGVVVPAPFFPRL
jgi:hypothetical protein